MLRYGIISPAYGVHQEFPTIALSQAAQADSRSVRIRNGEVHRVQGRTPELRDADNAKVATPDGNAVLKYHWFVMYSGTKHLLAFTKKHIYRWNAGVQAYATVLFTGSADTTEWSVATFKDQVIITNNIDKVQSWDGAAATTSPLGSANGIEYASGKYITKAKFLAVFENYLLAGNVTADGAADPHGLFWSDNGAPAFNTGDASSTTIPGNGRLSGTGRFGDFLILFKERSTRRLWLTSSDLIFNTAELSASLGSYAPDAAVNGVDGALYFYANDKTMRVINGNPGQLPEVAEAVTEQLRAIPDDYVHQVNATVVYEFGELVWTIPHGAQATDNNRLLVRDKNGQWGIREMAVSALGRYQRVSGADAYTIDTIPFDTIDTIGWATIDDIKSTAGYELDLAGDYSGYTHLLSGAELDDGAGYTGYTVLATDLVTSDAAGRVSGAGLRDFKRLLQIKPILRREEAGTVTISIKRDNEANWQTWTEGTVSLVDSDLPDFVEGNCPCDFRAKHFLIKVSGTNAFRLVGLLFEFQPAGAR